MEFKPLHVCMLVHVLSTCACSINQVAVSKFGDALSRSSSAFASDSDPDLVREAIPFGLKTYESLLAEVPDHEGLLLSAAYGFTAYAYLLQMEASSLAELDYVQARHLQTRAAKLYLRGRDYALRGLEVRHPGIKAALVTSSETALSVTVTQDLPLLYWAGAGWGGALSAAKDDPHLLAEVPVVRALMDRVLALDESFDGGAAHEFLITFEGSRPGGSLKRARHHYHRALSFSEGRRASVHLALAEVVAVQEQNLGDFRELLEKALAIDPEVQPSLRLQNTIAQKRAKWLLAHIPELFLETEENS